MNTHKSIQQNSCRISVGKTSGIIEFTLKIRVDANEGTVDFTVVSDSQEETASGDESHQFASSPTKPVLADAVSTDDVLAKMDQLLEYYKTAPAVAQPETESKVSAKRGNASLPKSSRTRSFSPSASASSEAPSLEDLFDKQGIWFDILYDELPITAPELASLVGYPAMPGPVPVRSFISERKSAIASHIESVFTNGYTESLEKMLSALDRIVPLLEGESELIALVQEKRAQSKEISVNLASRIVHGNACDVARRDMRRRSEEFDNLTDVIEQAISEILDNKVGRASSSLDEMRALHDYCLLKFSTPFNMDGIA